ncbi:MAG TPA: helix-turn-helix domain-containing protein [Candidatus Binatia bacterium]
MRERQEDIPILAKYFIRRFATETKKTFTEITADAEAKLVCYGWPGNVRELANVIERVVVLSDGPEIAGEDLPPRIADTETDGAADGFSYRRAVDSARADVIKRALAHTHGNRAAVARSLGLHKTHLLNLMKTLGIE